MISLGYIFPRLSTVDRHIDVGSITNIIVVKFRNVLEGGRLSQTIVIPTSLTVTKKSFRPVSFTIFGRSLRPSLTTQEQFYETKRK